MSLYQDNIVVEGQLQHSSKVETPTSTVTTAATLALTNLSTMAQIFTGSTAGQILKLPDATSLINGQKYEVFNGATVSVAIQNGSGSPLVVAPPGYLVIFRLLLNNTVAGSWAYTLIAQSQSASGQLFCSYSGTGLGVDYLAGVVYFGGLEYVIAAGTVTVSASITNGYIYVDPLTHVVSSGASLPNNAVPMAEFTSGLTTVTTLNDAREQVENNLVWAVTGDLSSQTSQSTANAGSIEKYARGDHKHAMNINLLKAGVVAGASFSGSPKTFAVVFASAYADAAYAIHIASTDGRTFVYASKTSAGFTISAQANQAITGEVSWTCTKSGEAS